MWPLLLKWWKPLAVVVVLAAWSGWVYVQGKDDVQQKWDAENARVATALSVVFEKSAKETEVIRETFIEYKRGAEAVTNRLELDVASGDKRLRIKAACRMPDPSIPSGTGSGTAELDPAARPAYYALRRGLDEQRGLLNLCRARLKLTTEKPLN